MDFFLPRSHEATKVARRFFDVEALLKSVRYHFCRTDLTDSTDFFLPRSHEATKVARRFFDVEALLKSVRYHFCLTDLKDSTDVFLIYNFVYKKSTYWIILRTSQ
jgi:hypothetical protein